MADITRFEVAAEVQTTDATATVIATLTPASDTVMTIAAVVQGKTTGGDVGSYFVRGCVKNVGGVLSSVGAQFIDIYEDPAATAMDAALTISGTTVRVSVTGILLTTINWACRMVGFEGGV